MINGFIANNEHDDIDLRTINSEKFLSMLIRESEHIDEHSYMSEIELRSDLDKIMAITLTKYQYGTPISHEIHKDLTRRGLESRIAYLNA